MMKSIPLFALLFLAFHMAVAQEGAFDQVSVGAGYANATYYSIDDGSTTSVNHADWDIAFSLGARDLGVLVNEASVGGLADVALYLTTAEDFATVDTTGMIRLYNDEQSWGSGAFNSVTTPGDPFDFGWGSYDPTTHKVNGTRVYVIKLRDDAYKKLMIELLDGSVYTFKYADLDGNNEVSQTVDKAAFSGKTLAYYSFANDAVLDLEPASWDLLFTRYHTTLDVGGGVLTEYPVTGVLINAGMQVAKVSGIDPQTVTYQDYDGPYGDSLDVIGHDWKGIDLSTFQWLIPDDLVYFVQTADSNLWKIQFVDFEGSSTGVTTLEKTFQASLVSALHELPEYVPAFQVYPNPVSEFARIDLELDEIRQIPVSLTLLSVDGQQLYRQVLALHNGQNRIELPVDQLAAGTYLIHVQIGADQIVRRIIKN